MKVKNYSIHPSVYFIVAALLIAYFFPREGKFRYQFYEGKPWRYGLLTAPSDFPIYKTDAEVQAERDRTIRFLLAATASISAASSIAHAGCKTESKTAIVMSNDINFFTCVLSFLCLCLGFPSYFFLISLITSTIMQIIYPKTIMPTGTTTKIRKNLPIYSYMAASTMLPIFILSCPFQSNKMRRGPKHTHLSLVAFCYFHIPRPVRSHFHRTVIILYFTITVNGHIMFK